MIIISHIIMYLVIISSLDNNFSSTLLHESYDKILQGKFHIKILEITALDYG